MKKTWEENNQELLELMNHGKMQIRMQATNENLDYMESLLHEFDENGYIGNLEFSKRLSNIGTKRYQREFVKTKVNYMED